MGPYRRFIVERIKGISMKTYAKSFKTLEEAISFLDTLLEKEDFEIAKVAHEGGDIYFIESVKAERLYDYLRFAVTFYRDAAEFGQKQVRWQSWRRLPTEM